MATRTNGMKLLSALLVVFGGLPTMAQISGPIPLSWRWAQSTSVSPMGSPVVEGDRVMVAVGSRMYGLDRRTGNQLWRYPAGEPLAGHFRSGCVLAQNTLLANADNKTLYAVDATTGAPKWQYLSPDPFFGPPVVAGNFVVAQYANGSLMAVELENGNAAWAEPYQVPEGILGNLAGHAGNVIYFTQDFKAQSFDVAARRLNWTATFSTLNPGTTPVVLGEVFYVNTGTFVTAVNAGTGRARWQQDCGEPLTLAPGVSPSHVLVVSTEGRFFVLDSTGRFIVRRGQDLGSLAVTAPGALDKLFAICTSNGSINLIDPLTGDIVWNYIVRPMHRDATSDPKAPKYVAAAGPPILAGETLLQLALDGSLLAFDPTTGVDLTAPTIKMTFPNPGDQVSGQPPLVLQFVIEDEATGLNIDSVKVEINGAAMSHEITRDGVLSVRFSLAGGNRPLMDGRKEIVVTASDWKGNERKQSFSLTIDNTLRPVGGSSSGGG